jgi:hypothetical protein
VSSKEIEPDNQARLAQLTASAVTWHHAVEGALGDALGHAMNAGDALLAMRKLVPPGQWYAYLQANTDISERSAQVYVQVAKKRTELTRRASAGPLSIAAALKFLQDSERTKRSSTSGLARPKSKKSATLLDALGWWSGASLEQRRHFLDGVGRAGIQSAQPTGWRPLFTDAPVVASTEAPKNEATSPTDLLVALADADDDDRRDDVHARL